MLPLVAIGPAAAIPCGTGGQGRYVEYPVGLRLDCEYLMSLIIVDRANLISLS